MNSILDSDGLVSRDSDCLKSFYKNVNDNKDVSKLVMVLSSSSQSIRQEINAALQEFSSFQIVWENNLDDVIQVRNVADVQGKTKLATAGLLNLSTIFSVIYF